MSKRTARRRVKRPVPIGERLRLFLPARSWRLQLIAAGVGIAIALFSAQSFASARENSNVYLIQPGDTLLTIAASTGVSLERLIGVNAIKNPDVIIAGQSLQLDGPSASSPAQPAPAQMGPRYTVKAGDTLWQISQSSGVNVDSLIKLNNINDANTLSVGQQLVLPTQTSQSTPTQAQPTNASKQKPQATQSAAAAPPTNALLQRVSTEALRVGGTNVRVGVAATNLVTGEKIGLAADETFPSASVMKLPLLVELERQTATGSVAWTESLRAEAGAMIGVSDNSAANQIADIIHPQSVNDTMSRLGLNGTRFFNLFTDSRSSVNPGQNQTTPANMARLLELIATDQIVSPQVSADIRGLLARNADRSKLVRLLPPDARVAHKSGWYEGVANDVGMVSVDRVPTRWVIAVFTRNLPDGETGNQLIAAISRAVYDAWAP